MREPPAPGMENLLKREDSEQVSPEPLVGDVALSELPRSIGDQSHVEDPQPEMREGPMPEMAKLLDRTDSDQTSPTPIPGDVALRQHHRSSGDRSYDGDPKPQMGEGPLT